MIHKEDVRGNLKRKKQLDVEVRVKWSKWSQVLTREGCTLCLLQYLSFVEEV